MICIDNCEGVSRRILHGLLQVDALELVIDNCIDII